MLYDRCIDQHVLPLVPLALGLNFQLLLGSCEASLMVAGKKLHVGKLEVRDVP